MKIAVFYYSQTGQALTAAKNLFDSISSSSASVIYKPIIPKQEYPFPWSSYEFFDTFPETRLGIPPSGIQPIDFADIEDSEMIIIVGQSWFLSPSLPLQSFFADNQVKRFLYGRDIIFVNVCRNMWLMTIRWIKNYVKEIQANLVGHIVLQDKNPNLISAATIVRWLIYGRKESSGFLPNSGVAENELKQVNRFGTLIQDSIKYSSTAQLQQMLLSEGSIE